MSNSNYYLSPDGDDWRFHKQGGERAIRRFDTKEQAMEFGIEYMREHGGSLRIQKQDGTFQEERTYSPRNDPPSRPG